MFAKFVRRPLWPIALGVALALATGGVAGSSLEKRGLLAAPGETRPAAVSTDNELRPVSVTTFAPVVQKVMPSVVSIFSSRKAKADDRSWELLNEDPFLRRFFGDPFP